MAKKPGQALSSSPRGALASITTLIVRRIERQAAISQIVQFPGGKLRNELSPDCNSSSRDPQSPGDVCLGTKMSDGSVFTHAPKLSMPSDETQPSLAGGSLSLLYMSSQAWKRCETLADRLQWAIQHAEKSPADLARHLKISTAAMSEWFTGKVKNPKLRNIFLAAGYCKVYAWWLAIGEGTPFDEVDSRFDGISGQDLLIAKQLSDLNDRSLRETVERVIAAERSAANEHQKKRKA